MQGLEIVKGWILSHPKSPPFVVTLINVDNKPHSHAPPLPSPLKLCNQLHFTLGELTSHLNAFHIPFHSLNSSILLLWTILNLFVSYSKNHHLLLITRNIFCLDLLLKLGVLRILHKLFQFFVDWWQKATRLALNFRPLERSAQRKFWHTIKYVLSVHQCASLAQNSFWDLPSLNRKKRFFFSLSSKESSFGLFMSSW